MKQLVHGRRRKTVYGIWTRQRYPGSRKYHTLATRRIDSQLERDVTCYFTTSLVSSNWSQGSGVRIGTIGAAVLSITVIVVGAVERICSIGIIVRYPFYNLNIICHEWWNWTLHNNRIAAENIFIDDSGLIILMDNCRTTKALIQIAQIQEIGKDGRLWSLRILYRRRNFYFHQRSQYRCP